MKRYGIYGNHGYDCHEDEEPDGKWVRYTDHEAELRAARIEIEELKKRLEIYEDD
jgi:hypothetical protein